MNTGAHGKVTSNGGSSQTMDRYLLCARSERRWKGGVGRKRERAKMGVLLLGESGTGEGRGGGGRDHGSGYGGAGW